METDNIAVDLFVRADGSGLVNVKARDLGMSTVRGSVLYEFLQTIERSSAM